MSIIHSHSHTYPLDCFDLLLKYSVAMKCYAVRKILGIDEVIGVEFSQFIVMNAINRTIQLYFQSIELMKFNDILNPIDII